MSTESLIVMILVIAVVWGGLAASIVALVRRPEAADMPVGGEDTQVPDGA